MAALKEQILEFGVATLALPGESQSGDMHLVKSTPHGVLMAVADGLGHGPEAAFAAKMAVEALESHSHESVISLLKHCHETLRGTRGVVLSMAVIDADENTMTWAGVGNVEGALLHLDQEGKIIYETLVQRRGVVGGRLPPLNAMILPVAKGDVLLLVTDGIRSGYERALNLRATPQQIAEQILAQHNMGTDDALVLAGRYLGLA